MDRPVRTVMTPVLRPNWNIQGPLDLVLPIDPDPCPGVDWQALYDANQSHPHQDQYDAVGSPGTELEFAL